MLRFYETHCCALYEIDHLGKVERADMAVALVWANFRAHEQRPTMLLYTGVTRRVRTDHTYVNREDDYGGALTTFIDNHNLGVVVETPPQRNPKTGNAIKGWLWTPDWDAIAAHQASR